MGKKYRNNIEITSGFSYTAKLPIDDRSVQTTIADLSSLVNDNNVYDEMVVGVVSKGTYRYNQLNNKWVRLANTKIITRNSENIEVLDENLDDDSVDTINIKNNAITKDKLASDSVSTNKIENFAVNTEKLEDLAVTHEKLSSKSVTEDKLSDELNEILIKGTYGTSSMHEGDILPTGKIYIQYDI